MGNPMSRHYQVLGDAWAAHGRHMPQRIDPVGDPCVTHGGPVVYSLMTHERPRGQCIKLTGGDPCATRIKL